MAEQPLDFQLVRSAVRRRRGLVLAAALIGAGLGMGSVVLSPPMYASSSLVLLPIKAADPDQMAELVKTEIRIAMSDSVLAPAAESLRPRMSVEALARQVEVTAVTPLVLEIRGRDEQPARAEDISRAVADSEVGYAARSSSSLSNARRALLTAREKELTAALAQVAEQIRATTVRLRDEGPQSPQGKADATALARLTAEQGRLTLQRDEVQDDIGGVVQSSDGASVIQEPSPAERAGLVTRYLGAMVTGVLLAVLVLAGVITVLTRRDPRLYFRDDIADAVGIPVIASVRTRMTRSVADWISLLRDYSPRTVDAWAWRRALQQLVLVETPSQAAKRRGRGKMDHPRSIVVITMSADPRGLTTGPQLAAYAASAGVRTRLVVLQRHETARTLWAAFAGLEQGQAVRPGLCVDTPHDDGPQADLTVALAVLDRDEPKLLEVPAGSVVVLALSAGSATAEQLARLAVAVDEAGERMHGVIVADPDSLDRTTGRLLQHDRVQQLPLPKRLTGAPTPRSPRPAAVTASGRQS